MSKTTPTRLGQKGFYISRGGEGSTFNINLALWHPKKGGKPAASVDDGCGLRWRGSLKDLGDVASRLLDKHMTGKKGGDIYEQAQKALQDT